MSDWQPIETAPEYVAGGEALIGKWDGEQWVEVVFWPPAWDGDAMESQGYTHWLRIAPPTASAPCPKCKAIVDMLEAGYHRLCEQEAATRAEAQRYMESQNRLAADAALMSAQILLVQSVISNDVACRARQIMEAPDE